VRDNDRVTRQIVRGVFLAFAVVVCPLLAWNLAVGAANRGVGWYSFVGLLLAVPVVGAVLVAVVLRRSGREATAGPAGAVVATFVIVVALIFVALSSR
jgi:hypothetical protein